MHPENCARLPFWFSLLLWAASTPLVAQAEPEAPDVTRLDVERLPPEAIEPTRDMYSVGFHVRAELGGQGYAGGVGRISRPGPAAHMAIGYDWTSWFALDAEFGLGMHTTDAPAPPASSTFQTYTALLQARLQWAVSTRAALWLSADGGGGMASGDFLQAWGYKNAGKIGLVYGGALGFDWHFMNPHQSIGLRTGAHLYPNLAAPSGEKSIAIEAGVYLRYVF
jgi:hypothetical protein